MVTEVIGFLPNPLGNLDKLKRILDEKNIEYTIHSDCDGDEVWVYTNDYYCKLLKKHKIIEKKDILNINEQNVSIIIFF